ncbi:MAG: SBBP repeat-containing protein [Promethearchaeota archaeon]
MLKKCLFALIGFFILFNTLLVPFSLFNPILSTSNSTITESESKNLSFTVNNDVSYLRDAGVPIDDLLSDIKIKETHLPFSGFIQNLGQVSTDSIEYYFSGQELSVGFGLSTITFVTSSHEAESVSFSLTFPGSQPVTPIGREKQAHYVNYFYGGFQLTNVPTWDEVWYYDLYPDIDLCYYMSSQGLKYDFIVHPGADPSLITVQVSESMTVSIADQTVSLQSRAQPESVSFQDTALQVFQVDHKLIDAQFVPKRGRQNCYGFRLDNFDSSQILTIDPLWLPFSTLLGGNFFDTGRQLVVDDTGNTYITGYTDSTNFPNSTNALNTTTNGAADVFVTKLNATGNGLVFSTYLGGSDDDEGYGIAVDTSGNSYITGRTNSSDFPTYNAYNTTHNGGTYEMFVTKLNATGNGLVFSTYLGGSDDDEGYGIAVDTSGNSYITGWTTSSDFPNSMSAFDTTSNGFTDGFITKLNATGNGLVFSTYLGGNGHDYAQAIVLDDNRNSYITGRTGSSNFPTQNANQSTHGGGAVDCFVTKLNATGTGLNFSTYLGGNGNDFGEGIVVDGQGNTYITGYTDSSSDFPIQNAYNSTYGGGLFDAFVTKLNNTGNGLVYSTFLGGNGDDQAYDIVIDDDGNSYLTGKTSSNNFPTLHAYDNTFGGNYDVFTTKMNVTGTELIFSTYLGHGAYEEGRAIAVDNVGDSYVTGYTASGVSFPLVNAYQNTSGGGSDVFVTKLSLDKDSPSIDLISPANNSAVQLGTIINLDIKDEHTAVSHVLYNWDGAPSNTSLAAPYDLTVPSSEVQHILKVFANDTAGNWEDKTFVFITDDTDPVITLNSPINESIQTPGTTIDFTITDVNGIDQVLYNWDYGNKFNLTSPYDLPLITGDGQHVLQIYALDPAGNRAEETFVFTTDGTGPIASLYNVANNSAHLAGTIIYLNLTEVTEVNQSYYKWDDGSLAPLAGPPYSVLLPAGDGPHILLISANDSLGNWFNTIFVLYTDEGIPPTITLDSPTNDSIQVSGTIISFTIWDNTTISQVLYSWDGDANMTLTAPYNILLPSGDGFHILYIYANDSSNNWTYKRFVFTTDDTGPIITLNSPTNATTHPSDTIISLTISDLNGVSHVLYSWDNGPNTTLNTPYTIALLGGDGLHVLRVYANDSLGNWAMKVYVFTIQDITSTTSITTTSTTTPIPTDFFTVEIFLIAFVALSVILWRIKDRKSED